jgi:hypothetical protein
MESFEATLQKFSYRELMQPFPEFQADSMVIIYLFNTNNDIEHLFLDCLKRKFIDGG